MIAVGRSDVEVIVPPEAAAHMRDAQANILDEIA
jgi:hypothetical protein